MFSIFIFLTALTDEANFTPGWKRNNVLPDGIKLAINWENVLKNTQFQHIRK